jgi:hypothetical protein
MRHYLSAVVLGVLSICFSAQAEELRSFNLTVQNGRFSPATIEVPAGIRFKIMLTNLGPGPEEFARETKVFPCLDRSRASSLKRKRCWGRG